MLQFGYFRIICYDFYAIETWSAKENLRILIFNIELNALGFAESMVSENYRQLFYVVDAQLHMLLIEWRHITI